MVFGFMILIIKIRITTQLERCFNNKIINISDINLYIINL